MIVVIVTYCFRWCAMKRMAICLHSVQYVCELWFSRYAFEPCVKDRVGAFPSQKYEKILPPLKKSLNLIRNSSLLITRSLFTVRSLNSWLSLYSCLSETINPKLARVLDWFYKNLNFFANRELFPGYIFDFFKAS